MSPTVPCGMFGQQVMSDGSCGCSDASDLVCNYGLWAIFGVVSLFLASTFMNMGSSSGRRRR
jgi:hypothetical protein